MQEKIKNLINDALSNLTTEKVDFLVDHPEDLKNGDYSTNVAMILAKNLKTNPKELAEKIVSFTRQDLAEEFEKIEVAGAGFINFYLSSKFFRGSIEEILNKKNFAGNDLFFGKKIMIDYTDPNPFKPFHIGHLMTNAIGESVARILECSGATVSRANYQGDVGLHVAKAIYGLLKNEKLQDKSGTNADQAKRIGEAYVAGSLAYENESKPASTQGFGPLRHSSSEARSEIEKINKKIYARDDDKINMIYDWGFKVTMDAFEDLYKMLGTKFDFYFLESQMAPIGENIVKDNLNSIFEESDPEGKTASCGAGGAIIFRGEKYDPKLHTRVFITTLGLPMYETKELGLTVEKFKTLPGMDLSIVVTANEQKDYMKVVSKAISLIYPKYADKMKHITHGMMRLSTGRKMSSRDGNVVTGESLIRDTIDLVSLKIKDREYDEELKIKIAEQVGVGAIKYSILKQSTGGDIAYDFEKSISFEGDSGPYLQYSYVRAKSALEKAMQENILPDPHLKNAPTEIFELEKILYKFPEVVERSAEEYEPHYIANYLIEVAHAFNNFYGNNTIVNKEDKTSPYKIALTFAFSFVMKKGLHLLGIEAPEKM